MRRRPTLSPVIAAVVLTWTPRASPFQASDTSPGPFRTAAGPQVQARRAVPADPGVGLDRRGAAVTDTETGEPLFLARVADPATS